MFMGQSLSETEYRILKEVLIVSVGQGRAGREVPSKEHDPGRADVRGRVGFAVCVSWRLASGIVAFPSIVRQTHMCRQCSLVVNFTLDLYRTRYWFNMS